VDGSGSVDTQPAAEAEPVRVNPFAVRWYPVVNNTVGGWAVATEDYPVSVLDDRSGGALIVADLATERVARYIATLHNTQLGLLPPPRHSR
jgi:hypothetical protein